MTEPDDSASRPGALPPEPDPGGWRGRMLAAAAGAGVMLAALALRDNAPLRRRSRSAPPPRGWRERVAERLRGGRSN